MQDQKETSGNGHWHSAAGMISDLFWPSGKDDEMLGKVTDLLLNIATCKAV